MAKRTILVIEDDAAIRRGLIDALRYAGYETAEAARGDLGLEMAIKVDCDLVLLDLILPGRDGLDILREVRATRPVLPVIILTARGQESDRVLGLRLGADDYVLKPFSVKELLARVEAVLRRSPERPIDVTLLHWPDVTADLVRCEVRFRDGTRQDLTERERELLRYLACNAGRTLSRDEILARVWRINPRAAIATRTIDMHVARLREKLRDDPACPRIILTAKGKGYRLALQEGEAPCDRD